MAKGKFTGGRQWRPGESGNKRGGTPMPPDIREARKMTQYELERILNRYMDMHPTEVAAILESPPTHLRMIELVVASIVFKAAQGGDPVRLDFLLNRTIGKIRERVEVDVVREKLQAMSKQELIERMEADLMRLKQSQAEETLDVTANCLPPRDGS